MTTRIFSNLNQVDQMLKKEILMSDYEKFVGF